MARLHVLQAFGVSIAGRKREYIRGIFEVKDDDLTAITSSDIGSRLLTAGLLRVIEDSQPSTYEARTEAPKKKRTRKRSTKPDQTDDDSPAEDSDPE